MKKNLKAKQYIIIFSIVILLLLRIYIAYRAENSTSIIVPPQEKLHQNTDRVSQNTITMIVSKKKILLDIIENKPLIEDMKTAQEKGVLHFSGKNYAGLGFFVTSIEDLYSGDGKNIFYYVDGTEASVGVSVFIPTSGEVIEWKLQ